MVYSNDEVQDKLNNSSNSNADARAVRDLSASNDKNAKEESNKAKQEMLIEEAVENNEAFKRLRQTLYKTTSGKVQVSAEDIVEIYSSLVSPSANTVGDKGAFFVDDGLITAAVGAMCYDISVEENGVVLNVDGTLNIEATKHQVAMISGNVPRDEMDKYKAGIMAEKALFISENDINKSMELDVKTEKFTRQFYGKNKRELRNILSDKNVLDEMDSSNKSEEMNQSIDDKRRESNFETAEDVFVMAYCEKMYDYEKQLEKITDPKERETVELMQLGVLRTIQNLANTGNKAAQKMVKDGKISRESVSGAFKRYRDSYSAKEGLEFLKDFPVKKLKKFLDTESLNLQDNKTKQKIIKVALSLYFSNNSKVSKSDRMTAYRYLTALGLTDAKGVKQEELTKEFNLLLHCEKNRQEIVKEVSGVDEILDIAMDEFDEEAKQHRRDLQEEINNGKFSNRTEDDLKNFKKQSKNEEEVKLSLRKRINQGLRKIYRDARNDKISEELEELFNKLGVEENIYKSAIIGKTYLYNRELWKEALASGDEEKAQKYQENVRVIASYVEKNQGKYRDIAGASGRINHGNVEKLVEDLDGFEVNDWLEQQGASDANISDIFEESWKEKKNPKYIAKAILRTAKKFTKTGIMQIKVSKIGNVLFGNIKNLLPSGKQEEIDNNHSGELLTQEQIDLLIAKMQGKDMSEELKEVTDDEKSFDESLKVDVDPKDVLKKIKEDRAKPVLKVDEKTLRKMAFEVCEKNGLNPLEINNASIEDLQTLLNCYGEGLDAQVQLQDERPAQEGMEI